MQSSSNALRWLAGIMAACLLAVALALVSQHVFDIQPCSWCVLQRLVFLAIAVVCALGLALGRYRILISGLVLILALLGAAAAWWQHFVAAKAASCNLTLADTIVRRKLHLDQLLPSVFDARASCADAAVSLLGVPYEFWSLGLFAMIGIAAIQYMRQQVRAG
jgi:disulfide bond formation protein DsbB